jgi:tight adherence protein C
MSDRALVLSGLISGVLLLVGAAVAILLREAARQDLEVRVGAVVSVKHGGDPATGSEGLLGGITGLLGQLGNAVRKGTRFYSEEGLATLEGMIEASGMRPKRLVPVILGAKVVSLFLIPFAAYVYCVLGGYSTAVRFMVVAFALPLGVLGPDWILRALRVPYIKALRRGIADALDLLVVCTEAGMGLESSLEVVAREIHNSNRPMGTALTRLLDELKVLPDRQQALQNFGQRSGVEGIRRMTTILVQTLQYGTSLGQAMRAVANELRRERMTRLEEKAIRLPALLVFPLILFIMPSFFIVMAGSPILRLLDFLRATHAHIGG